MEEEEYENKHPNIPNLPGENEDDLGMRKMEHFKMQCRSILGPSKPINPKSSNMLHIDAFDDDEYDENLAPKINLVRTEDGKTLMLTKDYRGLMDIVNAYKTLKQAVTKSGNGLTDNRQSMTGGSKGYLKMTIAAQ